MASTGVRKPATAGRVVRRMVLVAVLVAAAVLAERGQLQGLSDRVFGPRIAWSNDYQMTTYLYGLIERRHLTDVRRECEVLNIHGGDPANATHLDVFERPTVACMGPDGPKLRVLPRLFGLLVDRDRGTVQTDIGSPDSYHPVSRSLF